MCCLGLLKDAIWQQDHPFTTLWSLSLRTAVQMNHEAITTPTFPDKLWGRPVGARANVMVDLVFRNGVFREGPLAPKRAVVPFSVKGLPCIFAISDGRRRRPKIG